MDKTILVVEDSPTQAMLLENILERHSYRAAIAADGEEALQWLSEHKPLLVISDIVMPRMNGYELCRQIKAQKNTKNIPVILLTSLNGTEEVIEGLVAGADSFITKPYDQDYLISHIEKILADQSGVDTEKESFGVEILFEGKKRIIQSDQQQTIKLLLNIYEGAIQQNTKLLQTQEQLKILNENLESLVDERTQELSEETKTNVQIAEKLKESEELWRTLVTTIPDIIALHDREARFLYLNHFAEGFTEKNTIGKSLYDFISDESKGIYRQYFENCLNTGNNQTFEYTAFGDNQAIRNYETTFVPIMDHGEVSMILAIARDITERKKNEENLLRNKVLLTETERAGKIGGWEFDVDTLNQTWTDEIFRILEIDLTQGAPKVPEGIDFINPDYRPMAVQAIQRAIEFGEPYNQEWQVTTTKGNKRWIHTVARIYQENGKTKTVSGSFQDITARKIAELKVIENENFIKTITSEVQEVIFAYDANGIFTFSEGKGLRKLGLESGQVVGMSALEIYKDYPDVVLALKSALNGQAIKSIGLDVGHLKFDTTLQPIFNTDGKVISVVGLSIDVTQEKKAEEEIKRKNDELLKVNAEKDKFFSIIAHDLRSPLSSFLGITQMMVEELPSMEKADLQEMLVSMEKSATNLFRLLENLLEWAKIQRGLVPFNPGVIQLNSIVGESVEMLVESIKNKEVEISYDVPADSWVIADSNMLQTVIRNLVSNAVKFTPKGGIISLLTKATGNQSIEISIKDSGIGMSPEILNNLFQLNIKTNRPGTDGEPSSGLGLLLCKEFIEKLGGKIWVESEVGKGSAFHFTLPCPANSKEKIVEPTLDLNDEKEIKVNPEVSGLKILIAENDADSEMLITVAVKTIAKEVLKVRTGVEAVDACRKNPDIDLVLMDIHMHEMDGYEATRQIRKFNTELVILAHTAFAFNEDRARAMEAGCTDYLRKPIKKAELMNHVLKYCKK